MITRFVGKCLNSVHTPLGVMALSKREIQRFLSVSTQTLFPPLISSSLFIMIFGLTIGRSNQLASMETSYLGFIIPGLITMHLISSSYENVSSSLFIARWHNHIQEILLSPLSYFEMVLGLLTGGVVRGIIVATGVFLISRIFYTTPIVHPFLMIYFLLTIAIIFACFGMIAALWAEDFNMLGMWSTYIILPAVFVGGVFHPIEMIPPILRLLSKFNPMFYFINGMRYSMTDISEAPIFYCALITLGIAVGIFLFTVHLFRIGYKLRT